MSWHAFHEPPRTGTGGGLVRQFRVSPVGACYDRDIRLYSGPAGYCELCIHSASDDPGSRERRRWSRCELPHPARADAVAEGGASCFHDVVRLRLTAREMQSHERALQIRVYPQGAQSPQACLWSVPLLVSRRGSSVGQRTLFVAFERCPLLWTSQGASRSSWNDERVEVHRPERPSYNLVGRSLIKMLVWACRTGENTVSN